MNYRISHKIYFFLISFWLLISFAGPVAAQGQESLKFSITPPLFKISMNPGQTWPGTVKLVNNNSYAVTMYAEVLDFKSGATGGVEFIKDSGGGKREGALSSWVEINREPIVIESGQSQEIPFNIKLPADAGPGGHYAAILIGSKPPEATAEGSAIKISSMLASLLLVRVSGEVVERGEIREFSVEKSLSGDLSAKFKVKFANTGNTHLLPQGELRLTNLWGETRAVFPINQKSNFGNVLPNSEKVWDYSWHGSSTLMDAGRLRADLVIGFGEEVPQTDTRTVYFWTFNLKPTAIVFGSIIFIILLIVLLIRGYIRRSLRQVRAQAENLTPNVQAPPIASERAALAAVPGRDQAVEELAPRRPLKRIAIIISVLIIAVLLALDFYYFGGTKQPVAPESVKPTVDTVPAAQESGSASSTDGSTVKTADVISVPAVATSSTSTPAVPAVATTTTEKISKVKILNGGGAPGTAAKAAELIKATGAEVTALGNAANFDYQATEIRYRAGAEAMAEAIKRSLGGTATLIEDSQITEDLLVILGKDYK